jgi:DNA-binding CsgD family transcriptional regulator
MHGRFRIQYLGMFRTNEFLLQLTPEATAETAGDFSKKLGLTRREGEVLSWLSKGKTNRDIAQILGLSPRTVDKHLEQIYAKLGVENRTAAVAFAADVHQRRG